MRFYRFLLHLFPASFRTDYGDEMSAIFAKHRRRVSGVVGLVALWSSTIADVVVQAAAVHCDLLRQDIPHAARPLAQSRGFTVTAFLVTALGIGANTAVFSLTDHVLLRALPFSDPARLVEIWEKLLPPYDQMDVSPANYR